MRILLDESRPRRLRRVFAGHEVVTVAEAGWSGVENGGLLRLAPRNVGVLPITVAVLVARNNPMFNRTRRFMP